MRRIAIYAALVIVVVAAFVAYGVATRPIVIERPSLGGPPPAARKHQDLVGSKAPAFEAVDLSGRPAGTSAIRGRVAVVNIWATWCKPCVEELPRVEREIWQRFRPDVAVVAIAQGQRAPVVAEFQRKANLTFPLVPDPGGALSRGFGSNAIPRTYVINRAGIIVHQQIGYGEESFKRLVAAVERAVNER